MKTNYFYLIASLVVCMAGCTANEEGGDGPQPGFERDAYTSVTIKLPAVNGTKAANPSYDNGDPKEYEVKDLTLLFFRAPDGLSDVEDDYVLSEFVSTISSLQTVSGGGTLNVTLPSPDATGSKDGITQRFSTGAIPISETSTHVLALLNLTGASSSMGGDLTKLLRIGNTFKQINGSIPLINLSDLTGKDGFLMVTAPIWNAVKNHASTLTKITPRSQEEATEDKNKTAISVERIVAKVSLAANIVDYVEHDSDGYSTFKVAAGSHAGDKIQILGWLLGNTNKVTYPFRKVDDEWASLSPFVWNNGILSATRIHWAKDPNYTSSETPSFNNPDISKSGLTWNSLTSDDTPTHEYCLENTCNYDIMYKSNVTRAIVKAKYYPNANNQAGGNNTRDNDDSWWSFTSIAAHYSAVNMYKEIAKWVIDHKSELNFPADKDALPEFTANNNAGTLS